MIEKQHQLTQSWDFASSLKQLFPSAAGDPFHVIPPCVIGSAVAGALSMAFKCTLMAPHGGIFVFPVVGNALMYIIALAIGSIVGAVMLGLLRKPVESK